MEAASGFLAHPRRDLLRPVFHPRIVRAQRGESGTGPRTLPPPGEQGRGARGVVLKADDHGRRKLSVSPTPHHELTSPSTGEAARRGRAVTLRFDNSKHRLPPTGTETGSRTILRRWRGSAACAALPLLFPSSQTAVHPEVALTGGPLGAEERRTPGSHGDASRFR